MDTEHPVVADAGEAGWWQISARPDIAALAVATWGLWIYFSAIEERVTTRAVAASLLFYAAWSFKQTTVTVFIACCLTLLFGPRWIRGFFWLCAPFAISVALTFLIGGRNYFLNTVYAPSVNSFSISAGVSEIARALMDSPFIWLGGALGATALLSGRLKVDGGEPMALPVSRMLLIGYGLAVLADCCRICRLGSARNTHFEAFLCSAALTSVLIGTILYNCCGQQSHNLWIVLLLSGLAINMVIVGTKLLPSTRFGRITLASREEFASRLELANQMRSLPAPVFIRVGILTLPWIANEDRYPAVMDDVLFYQAVTRRGDVQQYPIATLVMSHHFRSLLVTQQDPVFRWALEAGCTMTPSRKFHEWSLSYVDCRDGDRRAHPEGQ